MYNSAAGELQDMSQSAGKLARSMRHVDQRAAGLPHDLIKCPKHLHDVGRVKALTWFIENQQLRVFHQGAGDQRQTLLALWQVPEWTVGDVLKVHALDPTVRADSLFLGASAMQADGVEIA